jgi:hypothetical protein
MLHAWNKILENCSKVALEANEIFNILLEIFSLQTHFADWAVDVRVSDIILTNVFNVSG